MITTLNLVLLSGLAIALILSVQYLLRLRDRHYKLEVSEIKIQSVQKKLDKEKQEIDEVKQRLEEQKAPLDKKWDEIQTGYKILDEKVLNLQQEREVLDAKQLEIDQQKALIEQELIKIEELSHNFQFKWEQERQRNEQQRAEITKLRSQIKLEKDNVDLAKNQLITERQSFEEEKRKVIKRSGEAELLKIHYEQEKHNLVKQKTNLQEEEKKITEEKNKVEHEKTEIGKLKREILKEKEDLLRQKEQLDNMEKSIQRKVEWINQEREKIKQTELEIKNGLRQLTLRILRKIKEDKEQQDDQKEKKEILSEKSFPSNDSSLRLINDFSKDFQNIFEVVCWKRANDWSIGIGMLRELPENSTVQIFQHDVELHKAAMTDQFWQLDSMAPVSIKWNERGKPGDQKLTIVSENFDTPLLFKLKKHNHHAGKLVRYASTGAYLAIVPEQWQRAENLSGAASFPAEDCSIAGFRCHFFYLKDNNNTLIAFRKSDSHSLAIAPQGSRFQLAGDQLSYVDNEHGACFANRLPIIRDNSNSWNNVGLIMLGEEGEELPQKVWAIKPDTYTAKLDLNRLEEKGYIRLSRSLHSEFFINIYDLNYNLLENINFTYLEGLKKIEISQYPILPDAKGHQPIKLKFSHDKLCKVDQISEGDNNVVTTHDAEGTCAEMLPDPAMDKTDWLITDNIGREVKLKIRLQRLWWNLIAINEIPLKKNAIDRPIQLNLNQLSLIDKLGVYVWLPENHQIRKSFVGFEKNQARIFLFKTNEPGIFIRLREFIDQENLQNISGDQQIKFWLNIEQDNFVTLVDFISYIFRCKLDQCDFKALDVNELMAHIKNEHFFNLVRALNYQEIRLKYNLDLPEEIYQCGYCKHFIDVDYKTNHPTNSIIDHIQQCAEATKTNGNPFISFRIVTDLQEIRKLVALPIPVVYECLFCKNHFVNQSEDEICQHFVEVHQNEIMAETSASWQQDVEDDEILV